MKDLTQSLRALADLLDRPEFVGVPHPAIEVEGTHLVVGPPCVYFYWYMEPINSEDQHKDLIDFWVREDGSMQYDSTTPVEFNPKAPTLPPDLLAELDRLRG